MSRAIHLVSCVGKKSDRSCEARDLYRSDWFLKARRFVEGTGQAWFILSAKFGLLHPTQTVVPYEQTLNTMAIADRRAWSAKVLQEILVAVPDVAQVTFLAGERYREFLLPALEKHGVCTAVPMAGLGIGRQLSWLLSNSAR